MQDQELKAALKAYYNFEEFRKPQQEIIKSILNKQDTIGILPTGTGKSLCYQLPGILTNNLTLVISPLVALMKDQVDTLNQRGVPTISLNSHLTPKNMREAIEGIIDDRYKIIYLAPEKLFSEDFKEVVKTLAIDHIAIDEAHCISQWGHDFRPKYKKIALALKELPIRPTISAFTATANQKVLEDIIKLLDLREPKIYQTSFNRPNLYLDVKLYQDKGKFLLSYLKNLKETDRGLVYCNTRGEVERIYKKLRENNIQAGMYHAGLKKKERQEIQDEFFNDQHQVLIATNAFGMGLDKEDLTFIIHYNMPANLESYYQEIGRGGRGGQPCSCILLFGLKDVIVNKALGQERVYFKWRLEEKKAQLKEITDFAHTEKCYKAVLLKHFGEELEHCGNCGNCLGSFKERDATQEAQMILSTVYHTKGYYGSGTITAILKGKKTAKVKEKNLDQLSVYGLLKKEREEFIYYLTARLELDGYLEKKQNSKFDEQILITKEGLELLKGQKKLVLNIRES